MSYEAKTGIAVVESTDFTDDIIIPELQKLGNAEFSFLYGKDLTATVNKAEKFGVKAFDGNFSQLLQSPAFDVVVIAGNPKDHAKMTLAALEAGKHVMVETPLALEVKDLKALEFFFAKNDRNGKDSPLLLVLHSPRFSPLLKKLSGCVSKKIGPALINYCFNAPFIDRKSSKRINGAGRNLLEAAKIYDIFTSLIHAPVKDIKVSTLSDSPEDSDNFDNFIATFSFADGSLASLSFATIGNQSYPTHSMTVFCDENVFTLNDFHSASCCGSLEFKETSASYADGIPEMVREFIGSVRNPKAASPAPVKEQLDVARMSIAVEARLNAPVLPLVELLDISDEKTKEAVSLKEKALRKFDDIRHRF